MNALRIRLRTLLLVMIPISLLTALAVGVGRSRTIVQESVCDGNLSQMAMQLRNYRDAQGHFPPVHFTGDGEQPLQSWRVLVYVQLEPDFERGYNLGQPWNGPGNLPASRNVPSAFVCPNNQGESAPYSSYVAVIDRGVSSFERADAALHKDSADAAPQILVVEYPNSDILWNEPRDLDLADFAKLSPGADPRGLGVILADLSVRRMPLEEIRKLLGRREAQR